MKDCLNQELAEDDFVLIGLSDSGFSSTLYLGRIVRIAGPLLKVKIFEYKDNSPLITTVYSKSVYKLYEYIAIEHFLKVQNER